MDGIITNFEKEKKKREGLTHTTFPTQEEIIAINAIVDTYDKDEMVHMGHWNGECWKTFFKMLDEYALEKGLDRWDCRAVMLDKLLGTDITIDGKGNVTIKTNQNRQENTGE